MFVNDIERVRESVLYEREREREREREIELCNKKFEAKLFFPPQESRF